MVEQHIRTELTHLCIHTYMYTHRSSNAACMYVHMHIIDLNDIKHTHMNNNTYTAFVCCHGNNIQVRTHTECELYVGMKPQCSLVLHHARKYHHTQALKQIHKKRCMQQYCAHTHNTHTHTHTTYVHIYTVTRQSCGISE